MDDRAAHNAAMAGLWYFAILFVVGFVLGTARVFVLLPQLGETIAVLIELPIILAMAWIVCRSLITRFGVSDDAVSRLLMGAVGLTVLLAAEFVLGRYVFGRTLLEQVHRYQEPPGLLGLLGQLAFASFPYVQLLHTRRR
jgi:hypothetical protein